MEAIFTRMGFADRRRTGNRRRVALLRRAQHAGRASRARHAGHAVPRDAGAGRIRPARRSCARCCGRTPRRCRSATCRRTSRRSASSCPAASIAATISTSRTRRRSGRSKGSSSAKASRWRDLKGTLLAFAREMFSARRARAVPSELLPVHRAERGNRHQLLAVRRRRLRDVQEDRLDRARRLRHGASGGVRGGRLRPGALHRLRVGHRHRAHRDPAVSGRATSGCSTRTTCDSWSSFRTERPNAERDSRCVCSCLLAARLRRRRGVGRRDRRDARAARIRGRVDRDRSAATMPSSTSRSPPTVPTA